MLIAIAAAAVVASSHPAPTPEEYRAKAEQRTRDVAALVEARTNRCAARIMEASAPGVRYDRDAADPGALDRQPARGEAVLFSAVELKVDGCSLPVIRAANLPFMKIQAPPVDH